MSYNLRYPITFYLLHEESVNIISSRKKIYVKKEKCVCTLVHATGYSLMTTRGNKTGKSSILATILMRKHITLILVSQKSTLAVIFWQISSPTKPF